MKKFILYRNLQDYNQGKSCLTKNFNSLEELKLFLEDFKKVIKKGYIYTYN